jgi:magnesium chelatase family protein
MYSKTSTATVIGISAIPVEIETHIENGLPAFQLVGLPDNAVRESKERVQAAIKNGGYDLPAKKYTINLAPADLRKEGSAFDLPIALGVLIALRKIDEPDLEGTYMLGELAFDGSLRPIRGCLAIAAMLKRRNARRLFIPERNADEASIIEGIDVYPVGTLREAVSVLTGDVRMHPHRVDVAAMFQASSGSSSIDLHDVKGQATVKRALEVAAAGGHNLIMVGPPGAGKTMLAKRLPSILPPLTLQEALETTTIHSVTGLLAPSQSLVTQRPFRAPHHTISDAALVGGGHGAVRAGEITLAHHGVLFLDEVPEFQRNVLEVLRQPLEDRRIRISRSRMSVDYPANFMLICSMNPCPCGHFHSPLKECSCQPADIQRYMSKISGPLLDRIDIHVDVPAVRIQNLAADDGGETSAIVRGRVVAARERQIQRFHSRDNLFKNADMSPKDVEAFCTLDSSARDLLHKAMNRLNLSARAYDRVLKVSRSIADLGNSDAIAVDHILEAVQYRSLDRPYWNA